MIVKSEWTLRLNLLLWWFQSHLPPAFKTPLHSIKTTGNRGRRLKARHLKFESAVNLRRARLRKTYAYQSMAGASGMQARQSAENQID